MIRGRGGVCRGEIIERMRRQCLSDRTTFLKHDFGRGGTAGVPETYEVTVRQIARSSLTSSGHARRMCRLAQFIHAGTLLEIGTSLGLTTAYLASANPNARVISLEGCPELSRIARRNLEQLGIGNAEVITGNFDDTLPGALRLLGKADLVFIDGNHRGEALEEYFRQCLDYVQNDSVVVIDDIRCAPDMEQAWDRIRSHESVRVSLDFFSSGWLLFRKELSREHFRMRYF